MQTPLNKRVIGRHVPVPPMWPKKRKTSTKRAAEQAELGASSSELQAPAPAAAPVAAALKEKAHLLTPL